MYFIIIGLIGIVIPLLLIKVNSNWAKWVPTIIFLLATLGIGVKAKFFPAPEMAILGEIMYMMIFGSLTIGAFIGGIIVHYLKNKKRK